MISFGTHFLEELRHRLRVSEIVGKKVSLRKNGKEFGGLCPFHNEKTPSFTVNDEKGFYHCFGCQAHGDVISFVMETEGLPFADAVTQLAGIAGMALPESSSYSKEKDEKRKTIYDVLEMACNWFQSQLASGGGAEAREYLKHRSVDDVAIEKFRIGYAPDGYHALQQALAAKGISEKLMVDAGLLSKKDNGDVYDKFRYRVMFPIMDGRGRVVAFGGRVLGDAKPKYLNSPETEVFHKSYILYNEHHVRSLAFKTGKVVVCEGYMDVMAFDRAGIRIAVAPMGTAMTEYHLKRLWQMAKEPVICLDGDAAGKRAMYRAAELALPLLQPEYSLRFCMLPQGQDPDDYIKAQGADAMKQALRQSHSLSEVLFKHLRDEISLQTPDHWAALESRLQKICEMITHAGIKKHYQAFFRDQIWQLKREQKSKAFGNKNKQSDRAPSQELSHLSAHLNQRKMSVQELREASLISVLLHFPKLLYDDEVYAQLEELEFSSAMVHTLLDAMLEIISTEEDVSSQSLIVKLEKKGLHEYVNCVNRYHPHLGVVSSLPETGDAMRLWECCIHELQLVWLHNERAVLARHMDEDAVEKMTVLAQEIQTLETKIRTVQEMFND